MPQSASRPNVLAARSCDGVGDERAGDAGPRGRPCCRSRAGPERSRRPTRHGPGRRPAPGGRRSSRLPASLRVAAATTSRGEVDHRRGGTEVGGGHGGRLPTRLQALTSTNPAARRASRGMARVRAVQWATPTMSTPTTDLGGNPCPAMSVRSAATSKTSRSAMSIATGPARRSRSTTTTCSA